MIKNVILDFDGVILESNAIKIEGFYELFISFGEEKANFISNYFQKNAGLSRYDIFNHFFKIFFNETIDKEKSLYYNNKYSQIVKEKVINAKFVEGMREFLRKNIDFNLFIVSSSDENDLKDICSKIGIDRYFKEILGSPTKKEINIGSILEKYLLVKDETIYIGDSINDYQATIKNDLLFIGRNSGLYNFHQIDGLLVVENFLNLERTIKELKC